MPAMYCNPGAFPGRFRDGNELRERSTPFALNFPVTPSQGIPNFVFPFHAVPTGPSLYIHLLHCHPKYIK